MSALVIVVDMSKGAHGALCNPQLQAHIDSYVIIEKSTLLVLLAN